MSVLKSGDDCNYCVPLDARDGLVLGRLRQLLEGPHAAVSRLSGVAPEEPLEDVKVRRFRRLIRWVGRHHDQQAQRGRGGEWGHVRYEGTRMRCSGTRTGNYRKY